MLNVALLQLTAGQNPAENLEKGLAACRQAKAMGADIALFPEMWNTGYCISPDPEVLRASAVGPDSAFLSAFQTLAKALDMAIAVTYL